MVSLYKVRREEFAPVKAILEMAYPNEVEFSNRISGQENLFVVDSIESIVEISASNPYSKIVLGCEDRNSFTTDEVLDLAGLGVRKIANIYDVDDVLNKVTATYSEKVSIPVVSRQLKAEVLHTADSRIQLKGLVNNHIIGTSDAVVSMLKNLKNLLPYQQDILVIGENGAGKDALVRTYLDNSKRKIQGVLNIAEISSELFASELFGYKNGAFTGANKDAEGVISRYNRGIIFLDEIGELKLHDQAKLLRVLQNRQYRRIGDTETRDFDVQFVFATNRDLETSVEKGEFREDLYYRISAPSITVAPLRERVSDIPMLTQNILSSLNEKYSEQPKVISSDVIEVFKKMSWPGNIRHLQNVIKDLHFREESAEIGMETLISYAKKVKSRDAALQAISGRARDSYEVERLSENKQMQSSTMRI